MNKCYQFANYLMRLYEILKVLILFIHIVNKVIFNQNILITIEIKEFFINNTCFHELN